MIYTVFRQHFSCALGIAKGNKRGTRQFLVIRHRVGRLPFPTTRSCIIPEELPLRHLCIIHRRLLSITDSRQHRNPYYQIQQFSSHDFSNLYVYRPVSCDSVLHIDTSPTLMLQNYTFSSPHPNTIHPKPPQNPIPTTKSTIIWSRIHNILFPSLNTYMNLSFIK